MAARSVDLDEVDKETIHLLVFLFMQFLSQPEQAVIPGKIDFTNKGLFYTSNLLIMIFLLKNAVEK